MVEQGEDGRERRRDNGGENPELPVGIQCLFRPRKNRTSRLGKYTGLPVEVRHHKADGTYLVFANNGEDRFSAFRNELQKLDKPIHGNPKNYTFNNDGSLR